VAAEFNRCSRISEIDDEELRSLPVSGVFDAIDTESFVAFSRKASRGQSGVNTEADSGSKDAYNIRVNQQG
jgi:hypothetical protein